MTQAHSYVSTGSPPTGGDVACERVTRVISNADAAVSWDDFRSCYGTSEFASRVESCIRVSTCVASVGVDVSTECSYAALQCMGVKTVSAPPPPPPAPPPPPFQPELLEAQVCVECQSENLEYIRNHFFPDGGRPTMAGQSAVCGVASLGESECSSLWSKQACTTHAESSMVTVSHVNLRRDADWAGVYAHIEHGVPGLCMDCRVGDENDPRCLSVFTHAMEYRCNCIDSCPAQLAAQREAELEALQLEEAELEKLRQAARRYRTLSSECLPYTAGQGDRTGLQIIDTVSRFPPYSFFTEVDFNGGANEGGSARDAMDSEWERQAKMKARCDNFHRDADGDLNARLEIPCGATAPEGWEPQACIPDSPPPPPSPPDPPRTCEWVHLTKSLTQNFLSAWIYKDPYNDGAPEARGIRAECAVHNKSKSTPIALMRDQCIDISQFHEEAVANGLVSDPVLDYLVTTHANDAMAREAVAVFVPKMPVGSRILSFHDSNCERLFDVKSLEEAKTHFIGRYNQVFKGSDPETHAPLEQHFKDRLYNDILQWYGKLRHTVRDVVWGQNVQLLPGSEPNLRALKSILGPVYLHDWTMYGERSFRIIIPEAWHFECPINQVPAPTTDTDELDLYRRLKIFKCVPCPDPITYIIVGLTETCGRNQGACQQCAVGSFSNDAGDECVSCMLPEVPVMNADGTRYACMTCSAMQYPKLITPPFYECVDLKPLAVLWESGSWRLQYAQYIENNNYLFPKDAMGLSSPSFVDPDTFTLTACSSLPEPPLNYYRDGCGVPGSGLWVQITGKAFETYNGFQGMARFQGSNFYDEDGTLITASVTPEENAFVAPYASGRLRLCTLCGVGQYRTVPCEEDIAGGGQCLDCLTCADSTSAWSCTTHWFSHEIVTGCTTTSPTPTTDYTPTPCPIIKSDNGRHFIVAGCGSQSTSFKWWSGSSPYQYETNAGDVWQVTGQPVRGDRIKSGQDRTCTYDGSSDCQYEGAFVGKVSGDNIAEFTMLIPYCPPGHYVGVENPDTMSEYDVTNCRLCQSACESTQMKAEDNKPCDGSTNEDTQARCLAGCDVNYYRHESGSELTPDQCISCTMCQKGVL